MACREAGLHPSLCQGVQVSQHSTTGTAGPHHTSLAWQCHPHIPRQCQPHVSGHQRAALGYSAQGPRLSGLEASCRGRARFVQAWEK